MSFSSRTRSLRNARRRPSLESLEIRNLLSTAGVASVSPSDGAVLVQPPQQIVVAFNRNDIPGWLSGFDLQLEELNANGTTTPVWDPQSGLYPVENTDPSGSQLIVPLESQNIFTGAIQNITLQPGTYQIDLPAYSGVSYAASGTADGLTPLWNPFADHAIGTFTLLGQGATLAGATNLGTIGATVQTVSGSLAPANYQQAVDLYKINLAQGHSWQLGLSLGASAIGSGLQPALALFDAQGNVIATRNAGTGTAVDPIDPYLFSGLAPGTYYVGVSGAGNLPNVTGGYDPVTGTPGLVGLNQPGGPFPFQLDLVATPHDQAAQVTSFQVNRLDPLSPVPTSLTLTFSSAVALSNVFVVDAQQHALELLDSSGRVWATTAGSYNAQTATLQLMIDEPLPAGTYTLVSPTLGGLVDLTGAPVTAAGEPAGILGTFAVGQSGPAPPGDLGVLWPSTAAKVWPTAADSFVERTTLSPHSQATYRFVVTIPGLYKLQTQTAGGAMSLMLFGNGRTTVLTTGALANNPLNLAPGVYELRFANSGTAPIAVDWLLKYASIDWEKIIDNGVGQAYALNLGLVSSEASVGGSSALAGSAALAGPGATLGGFASGPIPSSLLATQTTSLMGVPTMATETIAVIGPTVESGSIAIADAASGLLPGIRYRSAPELAELDATLAAADQTPPQPPLLDPRVVPAQATAAIDPESARATADARALASARWLDSIGEMIEGWFQNGPSIAQPPHGHDDELTPMAITQKLDQSQPIAASNPFKQTRIASIDPTALTALVLAAAVAYRSRLVRIPRTNIALATSSAVVRRSIPPPHSAITRVPSTRQNPRG